MSVDDATVSFSLEVNVEPSLTEVRKLQTILYRTLNIVSRMTGGDEKLDKLIDNMQRAIQWANRLRLALAALQGLRMASGDPYAWAMAGLAVAEVGVSTYDAFEYEMRGR